MALGFAAFRFFGFKGLLVVAVLYGGYRLVTGFGGFGLLGDEDSAPAEAGVDDEGRAFVGFVLDDTQDFWTKALAERPEDYRKARLTLFTDRYSSACGGAQAATGPFYCPADEKVYIDLSFYRQLRERLGAPGDFAQAYVIAHEVGHHLQHIQGNLERGRDTGAGGGSVRVELQADCYAGVWAHSAQARGLLEAGDVEEALTAAQAIGDDALQKSATGTVQPESWSHGSSEQRMRWFSRGFDKGEIDACDTFSARQL